MSQASQRLAPWRPKPGARVAEMLARAREAFEASANDAADDDARREPPMMLVARKGPTSFAVHERGGRAPFVLSLGAAQPWLAIVLVAAATVFVLVFDRLRPSYGAGDALLTVVGPAARFGDGGASTALSEVEGIWPSLVVQRCEIDADEGQLRVQLRGVRDADAPRIVASLRAVLPDCHVSFVNAGFFPH